MCLIALSTATGDFLKRREMVQASDTNPVGFGMMYLNGDRVSTYRTMDKGIAEDPYGAFPKRGTVFATHWRFATAGAVNEANCHPFPILSRDFGDDMDLYVMFNGTLRQYADVSPQWSDTAIWAKVLRQRLLALPDPVAAVEDEWSEFWGEVEEEIGFNTALFLSPVCGFKAFPVLGDWHHTDEGVACSNEYSICDPYYREKQENAKVLKEIGGGKGTNRWVKDKYDTWQFVPYDEDEYQESLTSVEGGPIPVDHQIQIVDTGGYASPLTDDPGDEWEDPENHPAYGYARGYRRVTRKRGANGVPYLADACRVDAVDRYMDGTEDYDVLTRDFSETVGKG